MNFSIIVPTANKADRLKMLLARLCMTHWSREDFEVIVVGGIEGDGTKEAVRAFDGQLNLLYINTNPRGWENPANARNIGYRHARGKYSIMLDGDYLPSENILGEFAEGHRVAPLVYGFAVDSSKSSFGTVADAELFKRIIRVTINNGTKYAFGKPPQEQSLLYLAPFDSIMEGLGLQYGPMPEWLFSIETSEMLKIHGYDEDYMDGWGREDSDMACRLKASLPFVYKPKAACIHIWHGRAGPNGARDVTRNNTIFMHKCVNNPIDPIRNLVTSWGMRKESYIDFLTEYNPNDQTPGNIN